MVNVRYHTNTSFGQVGIRRHAENFPSVNSFLRQGESFTELKDKTLSLADIKNYPFVCLRHSMQLRQFIDDIFAEKGLAISPDIEADGADLLVPMISHNFGLGFVPQGMAQEAIDRGEVFRVTTDTDLPERYRQVKAFCL